MRKISVLVLSILFLISCATSGKKTGKDLSSESNAGIAVVYAMEKSQEITKETLFEYINDKAVFVPSAYSVLVDNDNIPGLDLILSQWKEYMADFCLNMMQDIAPDVDHLVESLTFDDAIFLVASDNSSITRYFKSFFEEDIKLIINGYLEKTDFSILNKAVDLYNSYAVVQNHFYENSVREIEKTDEVKYFTDIMTNLYFNTLAKSEEYVRTTPDPFADKTVIKVFGIY